MSPSGDNRIDTIFWIASEIESVDARDAYLRAACDSDPATRSRIEELLRAKQDARDYLEEPAAVVDPGKLPHDLSVAVEIPDSIGPYTLREQIGVGGMGVVYVAEQTQPVQRKVAIKIIKPGMDTKEVIARFDAERQALAFMEHPNIARVLDAGATESGRSYFVMELVRGIPVTEYCDQARMSPHERLDLFCTVCDAVQHAHQKGIIHRDIKPSNVLVTQVSAKPVVKVIDFGLAKATSGQKLTNQSLYTGFMRLMGTPVYMSPEQAGLSGLDVDTRSDVYSLGVLLYELLTGTTPLDKTSIQQNTHDELCKQIRETEAPKPSARISTLNSADRSTIAEKRYVEPQKLVQLLHGDLDQVVLKSIEKDRDRRYGTPQDLAADIKRYLDGKPVLAVPPSTWYLGRKYLRRHKVAVLTTASFLSFLILATVFSSWQAILTRQAKVAAEEHAAVALLSKRAAVKSKDDAEHALSIADEARARANAAKEVSRRLSYAASMQAADQYWNNHPGNPREMQRLLEAWIPIGNQPDLRDFAWRFQWTRLNLAAEQTVHGFRSALSPAGNLIVADIRGIREWDNVLKTFVVRWPGDASTDVSRLALSPTGRWAAVRKGPVMQLIEIETGKIVDELDGTRALFSTAGDHVMVWRDVDQFVDHQLWNLNTRSSQPQSHLKHAPNNAGSISQDGRSYAFAIKPHGSSLSLTLVACHAGQTTTFPQSTREIRCTAWSPNGRLLVSGHWGGVVKLRFIDQPKRELTLRTGRDMIYALAFTPDSRQLAVGGRDGNIEFYDVAHFHDAIATSPGHAAGANHDNDLTDDVSDPPTDISSFDLPKQIDSRHVHTDGVRQIVFSADGLKMATHDRSGVAKLWNLRERTNVVPTIEADKPPVGGLPLTLEIPDGDPTNGIRVASVDRNRIKILSGVLREQDRLVAFSDDKGILHEFDAGIDALDAWRMMASGPANSSIKLYVVAPMSTTERVVHIERSSENPSWYSATFTKDGSHLILAGTQCPLLRTVGGRFVRYFPTLGSRSAALSPDGGMLALDDDRELVLWDLKKDRLHRRLPAHVDSSSFPFGALGGVLAFSPNGKFLAMGTGNRFGIATKMRSDLKVWETETLTEIKSHKNTGIVSGVVFSHDSKRLIATDQNGKIRIWNTSTWELVDTLDGVTSANAIDISRDGKWLVQVGYRGVVIWDFVTRKKHFVDRNQSATDVAFHSDGRTFVMSRVDSRFTLWNAESAKPLMTIKVSSDDALLGCDFSPDGNALAVVSGDDVWLYEAYSKEQIDGHPLTVRMLANRGFGQIEDEQFGLAEETLRHVLSIQAKSRTTDPDDLEKTRRKLIPFLKKQGKLPTITKQPRSRHVTLGEPASLHVEAAVADGDAKLGYQWFLNGESIEHATGPVLKLDSVTARDLGRYHVEVCNETFEHLVAGSEAAYVRDVTKVVTRLGLRKEVFFSLNWWTVDDIGTFYNYPHRPDEQGEVRDFEIPRDIGEYYGVRLSGFLVPPRSGNYRFYICSDDSSELLLSTDELAENRRSIAKLDRWHIEPRQWESLKPENVSRSIWLEAGKRYWVETLFVENWGGDHLAVTWQLPDEPPPKNGAPPISGEYLEHFQLE